MNIFHLVNNPQWGGTERYVLDLARAQRADGHSVKVFTRRREALTAPFAAEGLLGGTLRFGGAFDVFTPLRLAKHIDKAAADGTLTVVHTHSLRGAGAALDARRLLRNPDARVKVVYSHHSIAPAPDTASARRLLSEIDGFVFISDAARAAFLTSAPAIPGGRLNTVHGAIAVERFPRPERPASDRAVRLIYCGRLVPEKGLDVLVRALASLKHLSWTLEVCGSGNSRDVMPVVRLARGLDVDSRIDWRGFESAPLARMAAADVLVLPSTSPEPGGVVALEAFSQGLPVVASATGVLTEFMTDGREGLLVAPGDHKALALALEKIITDHDARRAMAAHAAETFATNHSYTDFYRAIINVYNTNA